MSDRRRDIPVSITGQTHLKPLSSHRATSPPHVPSAPVPLTARPVAQLVERWTPGKGSPGSRRSGARYMKLLTGMARLVGAAAAS